MQCFESQLAGCRPPCLAVHSHSLSCMSHCSPFPEPYFSTIVGNALTFMGERSTATYWRHVFVTTWRDFISSPTTKLMDFTVQELEQGAAQFMLNSTQAWNAAYDDTDKARAIMHTLALWPKFHEFVEAQHKARLTEEAWDPLATSFDELTLEGEEDEGEAME